MTPRYPRSFAEILGWAREQGRRPSEARLRFAQYAVMPCPGGGLHSPTGTILARCVRSTACNTRARDVGKGAGNPAWR